MAQDGKVFRCTLDGYMDSLRNIAYRKLPFFFEYRKNPKPAQISKPLKGSGPFFEVRHTSLLYHCTFRPKSTMKVSLKHTCQVVRA